MFSSARQFILILVVWLIFCSYLSAQTATPIRIKVVVVTMFERGSATNPSASHNLLSCYSQK